MRERGVRVKKKIQAIEDSGSGMILTVARIRGLENLIGFLPRAFARGFMLVARIRGLQSNISRKVRYEIDNEAIIKRLRKIRLLRIRVL